MKELLRLLYGLQKIDTALDKVRDLRGDLPEHVEQIMAQINDLNSRITDIDTFLHQGLIDRQRKEKESLELIDKIEKYKAQQLKIRTNKEYDSLTKEIDGANEKIRIYEEEIETFTGQVQDKKEAREELSAQLTIMEAELAEKQTELDEINASTEKEEKMLLARRGKMVGLLTEPDVVSYTRIRDAKKGKAVVPVRRGSCSGCYNVVPPQLILQIKRSDRMYLCEHCGRILISQELSEDETPIL